MGTAANELWSAWTRRRDSRAFEALVRPELPHAFAFARRLGCDLPDAEDALQDALSRLASIRDDSLQAVGLRAWLCREVRTRARSRLRSERRRRTREAAVAVSPVSCGQEAGVSLHEEVEHVLAQLPEAERAAVELRYLHDLDYREMSLVLGLGEGACRQRVHRALTTLRKRFGENAAAIVAALPLPSVKGTSALLGTALAHSAPGPILHGGAAIMTISTQKTMLVVAAAIAGVLLTLGTQAVLIGLRPTPAESVPARSNAALVEKDQEIARLRSLLAAQREAAEPEQRTADNPSDRSAGAHPKARAARSGAAGSDPRAYLQLGEEWRKAILQASDLVKRQETWDLVRSHVASAEGNELLAALWAVRFTSHVDLDRAGLASLLTSHIESRDPGTRLLAWQAVIAMERATHGEGFALDPARSGALRREVAASLVNTRTEFLALLIKQSGYRVEGETSDVVLRLLDQDADPSETLRGLGTARHLSPEVEKRIMEIARSDPDLAAGVNRWITRGIEKKSRALVEFLLDGVEADMPGALAALSEGVLAEDAALVGDRLHRLFDSRENPNFQSRVVAAIGHAGDEASREWLLRLREREDVDPGVKFSATVAIRALDRKKQ